MNYDHYQKCIKLCGQCAIECIRCATACLNETDFKMLNRCIQLNRDCSSLCRLAVSAMSNDNPLASEIIDVCADMCDVCAAECERHTHDHCQICAQICRECAVECRNAIMPATIV